MYKRQFENTVKRIHEKPRVTLPYSDEQWENILALGDKVDQDLEAADVRLTMGGEPTFVSIDNQEGAEWNTAADGEHKRELSNVLFHKMKDEFGSGALIQYGQGKWYPGEPLPRWKLACYWRRDGEKIWNNDALMADLSRDSGFTHDDARKFMGQLIHELSIDPKNVHPAYEDPFYFVWEESSIPENVDPLDLDLADSLERQKLAELLKTGMNTPVGFAVPIAKDSTLHQWQSCKWSFRRKHLFLTPGNSPVGLRLPLKSIQYFDPEKQEKEFERDLFADVSDLKKKGEAPESHKFNSTTNIFKTCLVTEVRDGKIFVFMPPVSYLEDYLDLVYAVERAAEELNMPVLIEGYDPPKDIRLEKFMITPDPGVIEVNIQPSKSWKELLHNYGVLYKNARESRLTTEKFNLDGRHTGCLLYTSPSPRD